MRLIDADKVMETMFSKFDMQDLYLPIHFKTLVIDEMPEVKAIPVEWMKQFRNGLDNLSECKLMEAIDTIIDAYKAERKEA